MTKMNGLQAVTLCAAALVSPTCKPDDSEGLHAESINRDALIAKPEDAGNADFPFAIITQSKEQEQVHRTTVPVSDTYLIMEKRAHDLIAFLRIAPFDDRVLHELVGIGAPAVPALIEALKDKDNDLYIRGNAAYALGEIKDPQAVPPLIEALKDEDLVVRRVAAYALGKIKDPLAVPPLIEALKDEDLVVRREGWRVRLAAVHALGQIKDPRAFEPLIEALKDADTDVRQNAAYALGMIGDKRAISALDGRLDLLGEQDTHVRQAIEYSIKKLEGK